MIRVYIGTEPMQKIACEVLKYSIRARASEPVEFFEITDQTSRCALTGFSFARWHVPKLAKENGDSVAIYMDADIVVLSDIVELYRTMSLTKPALARPSADDRYFTSVMRLDCTKLSWDPGSLPVVNGALPEWLHNAVMWSAVNSPWRGDFGILSARWNDMDVVKDGTRALHYTDLKRQPWRYAGHPFGIVFQTELVAALKDGHIQRSDLQREISAGHVRADILLNP
jgi:hypothetical protein